jgi:methylenetetrahydrofolate dehydrogenase (NADP+) / methenyltetrahydrofolate cyclohydrolase
MTAKIIDGNAVAREIRGECRERVLRVVAQAGSPPGLAVLLVGSDPASRLYVKNKIRACADVGIQSFRHDYPADVKQDAVIEKIEELNEDPSVHGILVQLPLPPAFDMACILRTISADKDVDGFHLYNVGGLVAGGTVFPPCTPYGVLKLLQHENISLEGKNVVVVGASNVVGKPMALMLMQHEATVCICHAKTRDLAQFTLLADVLVVAAGYPNLILPQMVRTGAVVIDVGINRLKDGRFVGDVDFEARRPISRPSLAASAP